MKKTFIVLSAIMILSNANTFAYGYGQEKENVVGIHFFSLFYSNIHLKYERVIGEDISGVMNVGFMPAHEPPELFTEGLDVAPKLSGWSLTPEFRYYPGNNNGAPKGFYLAPYMRIDKYTFSMEEVYYNDLDQAFDATSKVSLGSLQGGIALGAQWLISDVFSIDWYFFAVSVASRKLTLSAESDDPKADFRTVEDEIESDADIGFPGMGEVSVETSKNKASVSLPFLTPGTRFGISFGYAF